MQRVTWLKSSLPCLAAFVLVALWSGRAYGQAGLRESLERLDTNNNGEIEPDEITPLARPYLERITQVRRMSLDRPNPIDKLQEAARIYYALQNGVAGKDVRPEGQGSVRPFGPDPDEPLVPEFGLAVVKYPYVQDDLQEADRTLRRSDRNRDGYIDRAEALDAKWTHRDPFDDDLDKDDRLSRLELGQRYARRRLLQGASDELVQKARRTGSDIRPTQEELSREDRSQWWKRGGNGFWLTASVLARFDLNKNGRLETQEYQDLGIPTPQVDVDRDGELSRDELFAYLSQMQNEAGDPADGIPGWFYELDANRDRQVSMSEFATEWTGEKLQEFASLDLNSDGFLTSLEVVRSKAMVGGSYSNRLAEVLPPGRTIISEIDVGDDFLIGDLNVQLSITHSNTSFLDAYLTGPDGQRIELFTEVGGRDDNFEETIFDDQSQFPINKAKPPFRGTFMPEGLLKRQPSLSHFNGSSAKGVWQLVIRGTRSERFGMLHSWSLRFRPIDAMLDQPAAAPTGDGPQPGQVSTAWPVDRRPPTERQPRPETRQPPEPQQQPVDYEAIGRRMEAAVRAGHMTKEQVRDAWIAIKARAKGKEDQSDRIRKEQWAGDKWSKGVRGEDAQQYRKLMESKQWREGKK